MHTYHKETNEIDLLHLRIIKICEKKINNFYCCIPIELMTCEYIWTNWRAAFFFEKGYIIIQSFSSMQLSICTFFISLPQSALWSSCLTAPLPNISDSAGNILPVISDGELLKSICHFSSSTLTYVWVNIEIFDWFIDWCVNLSII